MIIRGVPAPDPMTAVKTNVIRVRAGFHLDGERPYPEKCLAFVHTDVGEDLSEKPISINRWAYLHAHEMI